MAIWTDHVRTLSALPLAFLVLWLGTALPLRRIGRRNDISYGVYIYAFPVQQLLALAGANELGVLPYVVLAMLCTLPLAAASWFVIERPAMKLKRVTLSSDLLRLRRAERADAKAAQEAASPGVPDPAAS